MTNDAKQVLTDEEITHKWDTHVGVPCDDYPLVAADTITFARAIEAVVLARIAAPTPPAVQDAPVAQDAINGIAHALAWIGAAPHGDNCFVSEHYEGDPGSGCNCGKDGAENALQHASEILTGCPQPEICRGITCEFCLDTAPAAPQEAAPCLNCAACQPCALPSAVNGACPYGAAPQEAVPAGDIVLRFAGDIASAQRICVWANSFPQEGDEPNASFIYNDGSPYVADLLLAVGDENLPVPVGAWVTRTDDVFRILLGAAANPHALALDMLVAAGFVSQAKVDEACSLAIAVPASDMNEWANAALADIFGCSIGYDVDEGLPTEKKALLKHAAKLTAGQLSGNSGEFDAVILNWLETKVVEVREPLRYGSRHMFFSTPEERDGEVDPSDIREKVCAAIASMGKDGNHG